MEYLTREVFDTLIAIVIVIGLVLSSIRLYRDFTRPLSDGSRSEDDTQPTKIHNDN